MSSNIDSILDIKDNPNWSEIRMRLSGQYGEFKVDSIELRLKQTYYWKIKDYSKYVKEYIQFVRKNNGIATPAGQNSAAWKVFEYAEDKEDLVLAESWIKLAQAAQPMNPNYLDTWANIRYKLGEFEKAIDMQTTAVWAGRLDPIFIENLFKMHAGIPTWKYPIVFEAKRRISEEDAWLIVMQKLKRTTDSLVWQARVNSNNSINEKSKRIDVLFKYIDEFKPKRGVDQLNNDAWTVFENSNNNVQLKTALLWSRESLNIESGNFTFMDTYANLLFKLGKQSEAIEWEQKALDLCPEFYKTIYGQTLLKMKHGEKTWP